MFCSTVTSNSNTFWPEWSLFFNFTALQGWLLYMPISCFWGPRNPSAVQWNVCCAWLKRWFFSLSFPFDVYLCSWCRETLPFQAELANQLHRHAASQRPQSVQGAARPPLPAGDEGSLPQRSASPLGMAHRLTGGRSKASHPIHLSAQKNKPAAVPITHCICKHKDQITLI